MNNKDMLGDKLNKLPENLFVEILGTPLERIYEIEREEFKIYEKQKVFTTGCRGLDGLLGGGVETGAITEFVGEFGTGKTQIAHQLATTVQLPVKEKGLNAKVIYIDTEGTFRPERIIQIAKYRGLNPEKTLKNILYARAYTSEQMLSYLYKAITYLGKRVKLVIIDTLTGLNIEIIPEEKREAYESLLAFSLILLLKKSIKNKAAIVITNRGFMRDGKFWAVGDPLTSMLSTFRIHFEKILGGIWTAKILYSPDGKYGVCRFRISEKGIEDVD